MKILHTADWHLGKKTDGIDRLPEQRKVLAEICDIADRENADVVIVAGDLFDTVNPSNQAEKLYYKTLKRLTNQGKRPVIAIAGNHDSPHRIENPIPLAQECGIIFSGFPHTEIEPFTSDAGVQITKSAPGFIELLLPQYDYPLRVLLTPYANEFRLKKYLGAEEREEGLRTLLAEHWQENADKYCDEKGVNILTTHLFVTKKDEKPAPGDENVEPDGEKPILHVGGAQAIYTENFPQQMQYVALGHLHRQQEVADVPCPIVYSSSILAYSFAEENQTKYVMAVDIKPGAPAKTERIALTVGKKLHRKTFEKVEAAVAWLHENPETLVELTIVTDDYLTSVERRLLLNAHSGIIALIPRVLNPEHAETSENHIDLGRSTEALFIDFFKKNKNGQEPNEEIMAILKEVLGE